MNTQSQFMLGQQQLDVLLASKGGSHFVAVPMIMAAVASFNSRGEWSGMDQTVSLEI